MGHLSRLHDLSNLSRSMPVEDRAKITTRRQQDAFRPAHEDVRIHVGAQRNVASFPTKFPTPRRLTACGFGDDGMRGIAIMLAATLASASASAQLRSSSTTTTAHAVVL